MFSIIVAFWVADVRRVHSSPLLLTVLNFLFATVVLVLISYVVGRSFLSRGEPGLLLFGCGALVWGLASLVAAATSFHNFAVMPSISGTSGWLCAFFHLSGVILSLRPHGPIRRTRRWLGAAYGFSVVCVALLSVAAWAGWLPVFFVQGHGGTPVRYAVLGSAITMFALTSVLLAASSNGTPSRFVSYYALALSLIATGFFGVMIQVAIFSPLFWVSLATQFLGGACMLRAALAVTREPDTGQPSLALLQTAWRQSEWLAKFRRHPLRLFIWRYGLAVLAIGLATEFHALLTHEVGSALPPFITFFPAIVAVALLAGFGPGLLATLLSLFVLATRLLPGPGGEFNLALLSPPDRVAFVLFGATGLFTSGIAALYRTHREKAAAYDREAAVHETQARLAAFAEATFEGIVESEAGRIVDCNEQFANMTGYSIAELKGTDIGRFVAPEDRERVMANILQGAASCVEHGAIRKDGTRITVEARGQQVGADQARRHTAVRDITEQKKAQAQLRQHALELERIVQDRTATLQETVAQLEQYSYSISHDMRAPLRAMNQYSEFVLEEFGANLPAQAQTYLKHICSAAQRMDRLINDVLNYHRLVRAEMKLEPVDLDGLARDILQEYPMLHATQGQVQIQSPLGYVQANLAALTQCLSNLLGNAVKFVPAGVTPRIDLWTESVSGGFLRLWVQDNGIGIDSAHFERIWGIFQQVHDKGGYDGTGIGLSIVKKAVERMGGRVGVESTPGEGSRFWLELLRAEPGHDSSPPAAAILSPTVATGRLASPNPAGLWRILIIDDSTNDAFFLRHAIESDPQLQCVGTLSSGEEALKYFAGKPPYSDLERFPSPDLVFLDLKMPGADGFEVLRALRQRPSARTFRVVVLTSSQAPADEQQSRELGADGYETKPAGYLGYAELLVRTKAAMAGLSKISEAQVSI